MKWDFFVGTVALVLIGPLPDTLRAADRQWVSPSDSRLEIRGLPWFKENAPEFWRMPKSQKDNLPKAVWARAAAPDGGRIRFQSDTTRLSIKIKLDQKPGKPCYFDAYVDDALAGSALVKTEGESEITLFENGSRSEHTVTLYLPNNHEATLLSVGVDQNASIKIAKPFKREKPMVCYGSSVLQGSGVSHPGMTYPAGVARTLGIDFVNLGFAGAGKAEPVVVNLIGQVDACCYLFDLGKSYGNQTGEPYAAMLDAIRAAHPNTPIVCVTPIYSTNEANQPGYHEHSENLRALMRKAATDRIAKGDRNIHVVEGLDLFSEKDKDAFSDALHPNDTGSARMIQRLAPMVEKILSSSSP